MSLKKDLLPWISAAVLFCILSYLFNYNSGYPSDFLRVFFEQSYLVQVIGYPYYFSSFLVCFFFLLVFSALFFIAKKRSKNEFLQNIFMIAAFFFGVFAYYNFFTPFLLPPDIGWSYDYPFSALSSFVKAVVPVLLLNAAVLLFVVLGAVLFEKLKGQADKHAVYCTSLFVGVLFLMECFIFSNVMIVAAQLSVSEPAYGHCQDFFASQWTPQYQKSVIESHTESAEMQVDGWAAGQYSDERSRAYVDALGTDFLKNSILAGDLERDAQRLFNSCLGEQFRESGLPDDSFVQGVYFVLLSIVCFLFSRLVFTRERFRLEVMEKGTIIAGVLLWFGGMVSLNLPYLYFTDGLLAFVFSLFLPLAVLVPAAHWLGWRPSFLKKKQPKAKS
ncbi:MAG: hypothetical protein V1493_06265 [Candidatus Diapherotrites archaeon]